MRSEIEGFYRRRLRRGVPAAERRLRAIWRSPVRYADIGALQDTFLVSSVVMILVIRLQLFLT